MNDMICPHCQSKEFGSAKVPSGVVAVMSCPDCSELVVRFRDKAIALRKDVLYNGSKDERKLHLADVIAEFMEDGMFNMDMLQSPQFGHTEMIESSEETASDQELQPISDDELQRFIEFDLDKLDNLDYFRKNLE